MVMRREPARTTQDLALCGEEEVSDAVHHAAGVGGAPITNEPAARSCQARC